MSIKLGSIADRENIRPCNIILAVYSLHIVFYYFNASLERMHVDSIHKYLEFVTNAAVLQTQAFYRI